MTQIKAKEFIEKVELIEGVVIALWTNENTPVDDYDYKRKVADSTSIADWIEGRIKPKVGEITVRVIDGAHTAPHRGQKMSTLRASYTAE